MFTELNLKYWEELKGIRQNNMTSIVCVGIRKTWLFFDHVDLTSFFFLCLCLFPGLLVEHHKE